MKKILCGLIIIAQLVSCGRVSTPPDQTSGDTTQMDFETDGNGNIEVLAPDEQKDGDKEVGVDKGGNQSGGNGGSDFGGGGGFSIDFSGFFEGVGSFAGKVGGLVQAGMGEITGESKRKKKEAEKKAREIEGLLGEVEDLKGEIRNRAKELEDSTNGIASTDFNGEKDTQDAINRRGKDHNRDVENTRNKLPELGKNPSNTSPSNPDGRDPYPTPEKEKVRKTRDFLNGARKQVQGSSSGDDRKIREGILDTADNASDSAEDSYNRGENAEGDWKLDLARRLADLAISSAPIVGDIYDIANAINGENFITGDPIPPEEGIIQAANGIYSLATGGAFGAIGDAAKASKILKEIAKKKAKKEAKKRGREYLEKRNEGIDRQHKDAVDDLKSHDKAEHDIHSNTEKNRSPLPNDQKYSYGGKIKKQMEKRGWTDKSVEETMHNPDRTVPTRDTRNNPATGQRNDDPATAYIDKDGSYVVRNDKTGEIVQVSDKNDPNWITPFGI